MQRPCPGSVSRLCRTTKAQRAGSRVAGEPLSPELLLLMTALVTRKAFASLKVFEKLSKNQSPVLLAKKRHVRHTSCPMSNAVSVQPGDEVSFGPFRLDMVLGCLRRDGEVVALRPKIWRLLCAFAANPGRLLTKDELIEVVWEGTAVGDTLPNVSVTELRRVLGDDAKAPRYIQTVHGRGFRFIATIQQPEASRANGVVPTQLVVGRTREFDLLESVFDRDSDCRVGFVLGEAGIGKTSLLNALLERRGSAGGIVGRGQCVAHFGEVYPHLALLGALEDMCRRDERVLKSLRSIAPMWLTRLPGLIPIEEHEVLRGQRDEWVPSTAIDQLIALQEAVGGVVWAIEDLHWADHATV